MKKILDEQTKHRLIGLIVALAVMIIFLPVMMRHSDQNFDELTSFHIPKKPALPKVSTVDQKRMFKSVKIATVTLPHAPRVRSHLLAAQVLSKNVSVDLVKVEEKKRELPNQSEQVHNEHVQSPVVNLPTMQDTPEHKTLGMVDKLTTKQDLSDKSIRGKEVYAVQLGAFAQKANADALIQHLQTQGFSASQQIIKKAQGSLHQVIVGQMKERKQAVDLQKKLASNAHLNGLIVKTKVS